MAKNEITFASANQGMIVEGEQASISSAGGVAGSLARASANASGQLFDFAKKQMERDAAVMVADTLTSIQEDTEKDFYDAQSNMQSSMANPDPDKGVSSFDVLVNNPKGNPDNNRRPFSEYLLTNYDNRVKERLRMIKNPLAREELTKRLTYQRGELSSKALSFEARASLDMRKELLGQSAERMGRMILNDPSSFESNLTQLNAFVDKARVGFEGPAQKKIGANQLAIAAAEGMIRQDPVLATEMLKDENTPWVQHLSPEQVVVALNKADDKRKQVLAEERTELSGLETSHEKSLLETGQGIPGFEQRVKRAYADKPEVLQQKLDSFKVWQQSFVHKSNIEAKPLSEIGSYALAQKPKAGDSQFELKSHVAEYVEKMAQEQLTLSQKDPAKLAESIYPDDIEQIPANDLLARAQFKLAVQEKKGVPAHAQRLLTNTERESYVTAIQTAKPDQVLAVIQDIALQFDQGDPSQPSLSPTVFKELMSAQGLDPTYSALIQNVRDGSPVAFDIVRTLKLKDQLGKLLPGETEDQRTKMRSKVDKSMDDFAEAFLRGSAENLEPLNNLREVTTNLARMYVLDQNMAPDAAVKKAYTRLVDEKIADIDGALIIPKTISDGGKLMQPSSVKIKAGLAKVRSSLLDGRMDFGLEKTFSNIPAWATDADRKEVAQAALQNGYWKTTPDYSGAYYMLPLTGGDLPLLDKAGKPMFVSFTQAQSSWVDAKAFYKAFSGLGSGDYPE